jgi:hypothetical protein
MQNTRLKRNTVRPMPAPGTTSPSIILSFGGENHRSLIALIEAG